MLKKGLCLLTGIMMLFCQINVVHATNLASGAESAILIDANSQQVLYHKNETKRLYPASTTKIMTMILLFEAIKEKRINWNDTLSCSAYAASMGGSQIYLEENEKMSVNELFKCVAIASANDASVLIGEGIAGSHQEFVKMMNEKAKQLKLVNTHFKNCTGLHDVEHYTCAKDLATMGAYLIKIGGKKLFSVTSLYDSYIREKNHQKFWLVNTNKLLKQYQGVDGLKTGYTKEAGYCIVTTCKKDNLRLIGVLMNEDKPHQENRTRFLNLCDHQHKGNACKHSDKARHQHPKNRVNTSQKHKGKVDDKVDCGKDTDGNKVFSFQFFVRTHFRH